MLPRRVHSPFKQHSVRPEGYEKRNSKHFGRPTEAGQIQVILEKQEAPAFLPELACQ